jgi:hypothetical protein
VVSVTVKGYKENKFMTDSAIKPRKRLNLDLTPEAYELLQKLATESGKNMAEVLRTGLALYGIVSDEKKKGRSLAVVEDDQVKKEIVIP